MKRPSKSIDDGVGNMQRSWFLFLKIMCISESALQRSSGILSAENGVEFEGDMIIPKADADLFLEKKGIVDDPNEGRRKRNEKRWPMNTVPFVIDQSLSLDNQKKRGFLSNLFGSSKKKPMKELIANAMAKWSEDTCLKFQARTHEMDFVVFKKGDKCTSNVGHIPGAKTIVTVNEDCAGELVHLVGHVLGLYHEQSRMDRDKHITIKWENVPKEYKANFGKYYRFLKEPEKTEYDWHSVMHYRKDEFARPSSSSISINGFLNKVWKFWKDIGQRDEPTKNDIKKIKNLYDCK